MGIKSIDFTCAELDQQLKATSLYDSWDFAHATIAEGREDRMLRLTRETGQKHDRNSRLVFRRGRRLVAE